MAHRHTEHPTAEGKLYICAVKDVFSGRIVGYSIDDRMRSSLAVAAMRNAISLRRPSQIRAEGKLATINTAGLERTRVLYRRADVERLRAERGVGRYGRT